MRKRHPSRVPSEVDERHATVERLTRAGATIAEISRETNLSRTSVVRIRRARHVARRKRPALTALEVARAQALLDDGASIAEVVRTLGCGRSQIDDRFPGRAWPLETTLEYQRTLRALGIGYSAYQIDALWGEKKRRRAS